jgi:hypothetical protein
MEYRRQFGFPPFGLCAVLTSRLNHERRDEFTLQTLHLEILHNRPARVFKERGHLAHLFNSGRAMRPRGAHSLFHESPGSLSVK